MSESSFAARLAPSEAPAEGTPGLAPLRLAPILITPTKPLTPSHLKGLLWFDVLLRATRSVRPVVYDFNRTTYDITWQTLEFWDWLLRAEPDFGRDDVDDVALGRRYVGFHLAGRPRDLASMRRLREQVEGGWVHPASERLLGHWRRHYALLGIEDPDLLRTRPLPLTACEALARLAAEGLLLDARPLGGAAYLDLTDDGLPLRTLVDVDGLDNHLLCTLREFAGAGRNLGPIALLCDAELREDYALLERCLRRLGAEAFTLSIGRVSLPGSGAASARHGGWEDHTLERVAERVGRGVDPAAFRLGMRLYFVAALGAGDKTALRYELLTRFIGKAQALLDRPARGSREAALARLTGLVEARGYVDPYRAMTLLLTPGARDELAPLVRELFT
jgi:hypothetical protein